MRKLDLKRRTISAAEAVFETVFDPISRAKYGYIEDSTNEADPDRREYASAEQTEWLGAMAAAATSIVYSYNGLQNRINAMQGLYTDDLRGAEVMATADWVDSRLHRDVAEANVIEIAHELLNFTAEREI